MRSAFISGDGLYRYNLRRRWADGAALLIIGLNPSTADATEDDPTIRRCIGFAKSLQYSALYMGNLFAYRATDPAMLRRVTDPIGPENDAALTALASQSAGIIVAWGAHEMGRPYFWDRARVVTKLLNGIKYPYCFGLTKQGHPKHPLYLRADSPLVRYRGPA
jgi:hypothetical protein